MVDTNDIQRVFEKHNKCSNLAAFAKEIGASRQLIHKWYWGKSKPSYETLLWIKQGGKGAPYDNKIALDFCTDMISLLYGGVD